MGGIAIKRQLVFLVVVLLALPLAAQSSNTFAGFTWDQTDTPDRTTLLAPGVYGDLTMTLAPTTATGSPDFPTVPDLVFIDTLATGTQLEPPIDDPYGPRAINLPSGNSGTTQRSGFEMTWTNGRVLVNDTGDDLVVYESGSPGAPEAFVIRVHATGGAWTSWWYEADDGFGQYPPAGPDGAFATAFDLTDLGITAGASIDMIQIANLRDTDRLATGSDAQGGFIDPSGTVVPQNSLAATYGGGSLDPDPLYVASLHDVAGDPDTTYAFATFQWDQNNSPNESAKLAVGDQGGANITNQPTAAGPDQVDFPDILAGYDSNLTPGQYLAFTTDGSVPVNLPSGNDGTANRAGISFSWTGDIGIRNLAGDDFVVYESGTSGSPEGYMVRAFVEGGPGYTRWYHEPFDQFAAYGGVGTDGTFATAFDLTSLGVANGERVTEIQVANLRSTDLIDSATTTGFVFPEGAGADGGDTAQPYAGTSLDPDILYVGSFQAAVGPNTAPAISNLASTLTTLNEGGSITLTGDLSDAEGGDLEVTIDWGDGATPEVFIVPDGTTNFSRPHTYLDDNPTGTASDINTITVTVEDDQAETDTDSIDGTVNNVSPTLTGVAITNAEPGLPATLAGTINDAGILDPFTLQVNWGDGNIENFNYPAGTTTFSESHVYADAGTYVVNLLVTDDDLGSGTATASAVVAVIPPIPTASTLMLALMAAMLALAGVFIARR